ncbi:hypothetical protein [Bacteroides thetaiotaomicron]|uniref:hypothetical protein n=1 Tax=Bacteroides thetaiotaomicron TaxID=818 RepID=UPI001FB9C20E|nr:hypothetical protein [Bacteroides thetaiotaomicron]
MAQHEKKASSGISIKEVGNKMKRKILRILFINGTTQIVIPAIFIILVTSLSLLCLKVNVIRGSCFIFIISSVIVCVNLYNRSAFWNHICENTENTFVLLFCGLQYTGDFSYDNIYSHILVCMFFFYNLLLF